VAGSCAKISNRVTLNFDILTSKWGRASPVSWASLLPNFSFLRPSVLELWSGTGQTDRRTDRQRLSLHNAYALWGRRHNNVPSFSYWPKCRESSRPTWSLPHGRQSISFCHSTAATVIMKTNDAPSAFLLALSTCTDRPSPGDVTTSLWRQSDVTVT